MWRELGTVRGDRATLKTHLSLSLSLSLSPSLSLSLSTVICTAAMGNKVISKAAVLCP